MKGMTNALPVLIDASTLATKSDISDMETKTNANATFATKTALTTLQNATKAAVSEFAITETADKVTITTTAIDGATSKSEDIPAVTDTMAGIITAEWFKKLKELWEDAHPPGYTLTIKNGNSLDNSFYATLVPYCTVNDKKYYTNTNTGQIIIPGLQKDVLYKVYIADNFSSDGYSDSYITESPTNIVVTRKSYGFDITNPTLTDGSVKVVLTEST